MSFLEIDSRTRLFFREWGEGKPVVFLHGWALNADAWNGPMLHLSDQGFRCIAYDRRGHGRSSDPGRGFDFDTLASDLATLMDHLDLMEVSVVAHSIGCGEVTRYLTCQDTGRVSRLAFLAPTTPRLRQGPDFLEGIPSAYFEDMRQSWRQDFPNWITENAPPFFGDFVSPALIQWCIQTALQCSLKAAIECNQSLEHADFRAEFASIDLPVLILHGDADVGAPLDLTGRPSSKLLKNSRLEVYPGAPHGLIFTHLDRVNQDLLAFLTAPSVAS